MPSPSAIETVDLGSVLETRGLSRIGLRDLAVSLKDEDSRGAAREMLEIFGAHELSLGKPFRPGETVRHGYWITRLDGGDLGPLEVWEMDPGCTAYVKGATLALRYWLQQHETCERAGAAFDPPRGDQLCAVSDSVLKDRRPVEGVRYQDPSNMSGWYINTEDFTGSIEDMRIEHLYHLTAARPHLVRFLALPPGCRFRWTASADDVWFDESVGAGK